MHRVASLILVLAGTLAQPLATQDFSQQERVANWKEDLRVFAAALNGVRLPGEGKLPGQKDVARVYPHLADDLAALEAELSVLPDNVIAWRLARILASAHIGHNAIFPGDTHMLPMAFQWLADGPVVIAASAEFKATIGARVLKVGDLSGAQFLDAVSPYLSFETEGWRNLLAGAAMRRRTLLELVNVVQNNAVRLELEHPDGPLTLTVPFAAADGGLISLSEAFGLPVAFAATHPEQSYYWRESLADGRTLYIQYRQCADDPKQSFADFAAQTLAELDARKATRVIVDLRFNQGGSSRIVKPLVRGLSSRRKAVRTFVLTGPQTFSSGVMAAQELRTNARALVVGTPTGGLLGGYGEARSRSLPHSRLGMQWTTKRYASPDPVLPDVSVVTTVADIRAGRDPVLDAAIAAR